MQLYYVRSSAWNRNLQLVDEHRFQAKYQTLQKVYLKTFSDRLIMLACGTVGLARGGYTSEQSRALIRRAFSRPAESDHDEREANVVEILANFYRRYKYTFSLQIVSFSICYVLKFTVLRRKQILVFEIFPKRIIFYKISYLCSEAENG